MLIPHFIQNEISTVYLQAVFNFCNLSETALPDPDGTIAQVDRQHLLGCYPGLLAGVPDVGLGLSGDQTIWFFFDDDDVVG